MSIRATSIPGMFFKHFDPVPAVFRVEHLHVIPFQQTGQREDIPHIVVDDQHFLAGQNGVLLAELFEHLPLRFRQILFDTMEEQRRFVEQTFQRTDILHDDRFGQASQFGLFFRG